MFCLEYGKQLEISAIDPRSEYETTLTAPSEASNFSTCATARHNDVVDIEIESSDFGECALGIVHLLSHPDPASRNVFDIN